MLDHFDPVDTRFRRIDLQLDTVDQRLASPVLNMRSPQIIEVNVSDLAILGRIVDQAVKAAQARRNTLVGFYNNVILPQLCDAAMRSKDMVPYRERVVGGAEGRVLEIGIGSGLNLPFYRNVREIIGLEPAPRLIAMARRAAESISTPVKFIEGSAVAVPIEDRSIDTVLTTWTLCTIPDAARALSEMRRVLKPRGRLLFVEHGIAPEASVRAWQNWLTPPWKRISGGCHLNRPIRSIIAGAGFEFEHLETGYMPGLKAMSFLYQGSARP